MLLFFALNPGGSWGKQPGRADSEAYPRVVSLKGIWERRLLGRFSLNDLSPEKWTPVEIPAMASLKEGHFAAYRKRFNNPAQHEGERIFVHFNGVAFACEVYLNGQLVGRHGPTLEPFEVELTSQLQEKNELVVLVQNWTSGIDPQIMQITQINGLTQRRPSTIFRSYGAPLGRDFHSVTTGKGAKWGEKKVNGYSLLVNGEEKKGGEQGSGIDSRITNQRIPNNAAKQLALERAVGLNPFDAQYHLRLGWEYAHQWKEPDYHTRWLPAADISMDRAAYFAGVKNPHLHQELGNYWIMRSKSVYPNNPIHHEAWAKACWHYRKAQSLEQGAELKRMKKEIREYVWNFYPDEDMVNECFAHTR